MLFITRSKLHILLPFLSFHEICNIAKPMIGKKDQLFSSFISFDFPFRICPDVVFFFLWDPLFSCPLLT